MASVAPEIVVSGTVVAAPPGGVVVGTVVGATGHPALLALPPGVEYVRARNVPFAPLLPTDAVVDVFALDRDELHERALKGESTRPTVECLFHHSVKAAHHLEAFRQQGELGNWDYRGNTVVA